MDKSLEEQQYAILLANIRDTLRAPHGYAVIRRLFEDARLFMPCAAPQECGEYGLRVFFDNFFNDVEQADPAAALRLFADCRGLSPQQQEQ